LALTFQYPPRMTMNSDSWTPPEGATLFAWFLEVAQEAERSPDLLALIYPEQVDTFSCSLCGQCCQQPWQIQVDADYYAQWYAVFDQHPSGRFREPFIFSGQNTDERAVLRHQPGSTRCVFLDEDLLCFIHKEYGESAKPEICQRYPREASLSANLYSPSLKSSCKTAAQLLSETGELVLRMVQRPAQLSQEPEWLRLNQKQELPAQYLLPFYGLLLEGIWQHSISAVRSLRGCLKGLQILNSEPDSLQTEAGITQLYLEQVNHWRSDIHVYPTRWEEAIDLFSALNPFPSPALERFLKQLQKGLPYEISESLRAQIGEVLRNYLTRRLLNLNPYQAKGLTLFQFVFLQAYSLLAVQIQALALGWYDTQVLKPEHLRAAINQFETAALQNPAWFDRHQLEALDEATCLAAIRAATCLDLSLPAIV